MGYLKNSAAVVCIPVTADQQRNLLCCPKSELACPRSTLPQLCADDTDQVKPSGLLENVLRLWARGPQMETSRVA